ncbi:MAG: hypothetical protein H6667_07990 [Ardenticatenaceae bacterium]|nr:hypothetical protein [Ardenticatenaceae bacterium]MCB9444660.1 hypothetical protein [Ardenticatenaceae bacterium]
MAEIWTKIESFLSLEIFEGLSFFLALLLAVVPIISHIFSGKIRYFARIVDWLGIPVLSLMATFVAFYRQNIMLALVINAILVVYFVLWKIYIKQKTPKVNQLSPLYSSPDDQFRSNVIPPE